MARSSTSPVKRPPPSTVWKSFVAWKLHVVTSPNENTDRPRKRVAKLCAPSYTRASPWRRATVASASRSHGVPNTCVATIADVRGVIAASTAADRW